jgi:hypothetical protein
MVTAGVCLTSSGWSLLSTMLQLETTPICWGLTIRYTVQISFKEQ